MKVLTGDNDIAVNYVKGPNTAVIHDHLLGLQVAVCIEDIPELIQVLQATYNENSK